MIANLLDIAPLLLILTINAWATQKSFCLRILCVVG
jgi:hypothetical protein